MLHYDVLNSYWTAVVENQPHSLGIFIFFNLLRRIDVIYTTTVTLNDLINLNLNVVFIRSYRCCIFYEYTQWFPQIDVTYVGTCTLGCR